MEHGAPGSIGNSTRKIQAIANLLRSRDSSQRGKISVVAAYKVDHGRFGQNSGAPGAGESPDKQVEAFVVRVQTAQAQETWIAMELSRDCLCFFG